MGQIKTTRDFLNRCAEVGYKRICIGVSHKDIPHSVTFPFDSEGSVFGWPEPNIDRWPAIWKVCEEFELTGCGNGHQHQIIGPALTSGYYKLVHGKWVKQSLNQGKKVAKRQRSVATGDDSSNAANNQTK